MLWFESSVYSDSAHASCDSKYEEVIIQLKQDKDWEELCDLTHVEAIIRVTGFHDSNHV